MEGIEDVAIREWAEGLAGLTPEQIKHGLDSWNSDWPPSLVEFKNACLGKASGKNEFGLGYVPEYHRAPPIMKKSRLLSSDQREERRKESLSKIAEIKKMLGG